MANCSKVSVITRFVLTQPAVFIACVCWFGCLETDYPAREWTLSPGESLELNEAEKWTLDAIRLELDDPGFYEIQSGCNNTFALLYEDDDLFRVWQGGTIDVQLNNQARYVISMDRSSERDCKGPVSLSLISKTLGAACTADNECPANSWCSTVPDYQRCAPRVFSGASHQMDYVFVPSGTYLQGTPGATNNERRYTATISRNYFVSRTEVTQGQWKAATGGTNGSCFQGTSGTSCTTDNANDYGPVEQMDWFSALAFANWLSNNEGLTACYRLTDCDDETSGWHDGVHSGCTSATFSGLTCTGYRLLTESEWERAARGNTTSTYYWGEATDTEAVGLYAWFSENAESRTEAVGGKQANAFGLFDMSGNVWEWVWDWVYSGSNWVDYPIGSALDYLGPLSGSNRGIRGGSWDYGSLSLRSASRSNFGPSFRSNSVGFRLARTAN